MRKPFDVEAAYGQLEELETMKEHARSYAEVESLNRRIRKIQEKIFEEEDRQAQEYYNDSESIAQDEEMKQKNNEAHRRWKAEHGDDEAWWVEPNQ